MHVIDMWLMFKKNCKLTSSHKKHEKVKAFYKLNNRDKNTLSPMWYNFWEHKHC